MDLDFTFKKYHQLIEILRVKGYAFYTFKDLACNPKVKYPHVVLRHDVDRLPIRALKLARLEYFLGVRSTYFFRTKAFSFDAKIIKRIIDWGHEIGYHYEDLASAKGNMALAWKLFKKNLAKFKKFAEVVSIAMHGSPLSKWDNRTLWKNYDYHELGIEMEAYLDVPWDNYVYFTDVGRSWSNKNNFRDIVKGQVHPFKNVKTTHDLMEYISRSNGNLIISTHPERWADNKIAWTQVLLTDLCINFVKKAYKVVARNADYNTKLL